MIAALLLGAAWSVLLTAGIARRRIRLSLAYSLRELHDAIGDAGAPPRDHSYVLGLAGLVFFAVAAIVVPTLLLLVLDE